jgi:hypothetical protein
LFALITKVNEGESNTPCPSTLEVTYSSVGKLSKALRYREGQIMEIEEETIRDGKFGCGGVVV